MHFKLSLAAASVIIQALVAAIPFNSLPSTDIDPAISDNFVNAQENDFLVDVPRGYEANGMIDSCSFGFRIIRGHINCIILPPANIHAF